MLTEREVTAKLWGTVGDWPDDDTFTSVACEDLVWVLCRYKKAVELLDAVQIVRKRSESYGVWKRIKEFLNASN